MKIPLNPIIRQLNSVHSLTSDLLKIGFDTFSSTPRSLIGKYPLGRPSMRYQDGNIDLTEIKCKNRRWIELAEEKQY
jgi:hypothetical protein